MSDAGYRMMAKVHRRCKNMKRDGLAPVPPPRSLGGLVTFRDAGLKPFQDFALHVAAATAGKLREAYPFGEASGLLHAFDVGVAEENDVLDLLLAEQTGFRHHTRLLFEGSYRAIARIKP